MPPGRANECASLADDKHGGGEIECLPCPAPFKTTTQNQSACIACPPGQHSYSNDEAARLAIRLGYDCVSYTERALCGENEYFDAAEIEAGCKGCPHDHPEEESITEREKKAWETERCRSVASCSKEFACRKWDAVKAYGDLGEHGGGSDGPAIGVAVGLIVAAVAVTVVAASRGKALRSLARHSPGQPDPTDPDDSSAPDTSIVPARAVASTSLSLSGSDDCTAQV